MKMVAHVGSLERYGGRRVRDEVVMRVCKEVVEGVVGMVRGRRRWGDEMGGWCEVGGERVVRWVGWRGFGEVLEGRIRWGRVREWCGMEEVRLWGELEGRGVVRWREREKLVLRGDGGGFDGWKW